LQAQVDPLQQAAVGRRHAPGLQQEQVTRYQFAGRYLIHLSIAAHLDLGHDHLFEDSHGLFGAVLLGKAQGGVEDDDDQDGHGVLEVADEE